MAVARLEGKPASMLLRPGEGGGGWGVRELSREGEAQRANEQASAPSWPTSFMKYLMKGPGRPPSASKPSAVSCRVERERERERAGPGAECTPSQPSALPPRQTSSRSHARTSVMHGPPIAWAAAETFAFATSWVVPWISGKSRSCDSTVKGAGAPEASVEARRMARTSLSLLALPVTKRMERGEGDMVGRELEVVEVMMGEAGRVLDCGGCCSCDNAVDSLNVGQSEARGEAAE